MEQVNYIKNYFSKNKHDFESLLKIDTDNDSRFQSVKKEIDMLQKSIENKKEELHKVLETMYNKDFIPIQEQIIISYNNGKCDSPSCDLDFNSGLLVEDKNNSIVYNVDTKIGEIDIIVGYNYDLASIIVKRYKYTISKNYDYLKIKLLKESVIPFFEDNKVCCIDIVNNKLEKDLGHYGYSKVLKNVKGKEFIDTLYKIDSNITDLSLYDLIQCYSKNKSFEIIIKTSPKEIIKDLLKLRIEETIPIHKIIGISLDTYNKALERDLIKEVFNHRNYISGKENAKLRVNKTENEWLSFIEDMKHYEEDITFYKINYYRYNYGNNFSILSSLLSNYQENEVFYNNYSLGKWVNYVFNETINQGYTCLEDFIRELQDYLTMCLYDNIKPTLYSSYLKQTHDITSRNHNIIVEEESEIMFKEKYKDFKEFIGKNYCVVAPKNTQDLKNEGNNLNHCVGSYIKRVIDGECLIYFLRKEKDESLITFEVRHNTIMQVKGLHNRKPNEREIIALKDFAKYRNMEVCF